MDEPLTDAEHEIVKQEWEKAYAIELALKEQMERVLEVIDEQISQATGGIDSTTDRFWRGYWVGIKQRMEFIKAELERENG